MTDFSYYKNIGVLTAVHEEALESYLADSKRIKTSMTDSFGSMLGKKTALNKIWGSRGYACFNILSRPEATTLNVSMVYSDISSPEIKSGDSIMLLTNSGTYVSAQVDSGSLSQIKIKNGASVSAHVKAIIFLSPSAGQVGGK
ncbi:MAG: hypothetical protein GX763_05865 [Clostridiaceae bacterium]|nr:hypothetical protein [Clostridiaceae bacterium]